MKRYTLTFIFSALAAVSCCAPASAQESELPASDQPPLELGEEWTQYRREQGSGGASRPCLTWWYLPNRILDLVDIVRVDVGVGPSFGAVVRITKWGQIGYRDFDPLSVRAGLMGRDWPFMLERSNEMGAGPFYAPSLDRDVSPVEIGAGVDMLIAGVYAGISLDGIADFLAGFACFDPSGDDR